MARVREAIAANDPGDVKDAEDIYVHLTPNETRDVALAFLLMDLQDYPLEDPEEE